MTSHPAYRHDDTLHTLHGMVVSVFEATSNAWSLRLITAHGSRRAWLSKDVMEVPVGAGQTWIFTGETKDLGEYGEQFDIKSAFPELPAGPLLIPFLSQHVPGLGATSARRLWNILGRELVWHLARGDVSTLALAHGGPIASKVARLAIEVWAATVSYTELARELYRYGITEPVLRQFVNHYGDRSLEYVRDDPYRLLAFTGFHPTDEAARRGFGIRPHDGRRLMGIVESAVHMLYDTQSVIVTKEQLENAISRISTVSNDDIRIAIRLAVQHGRLIAVGRQHLIGEGFARIEASVIRHLKHCMGWTQERPARGTNVPELKSSGTGQMAFQVPSARVSIVVAREATSGLGFIRDMAIVLSAEGDICHVIAGTPALRNRLEAATGIQAVALRDALSSELSEPASTAQAEVLRSIIIVSSTIDFRAMAQLVEHLRASDRLIFIGQPLSHAGNRALLLPSLLSINRIPRTDLVDTVKDHCSLAGAKPGIMRLSNWSRNVYSARQSERRGVFCLSVAEAIFDRVIVGLSHQLKRHGNVAVVAQDLAEWEKYSRLILDAEIDSDLVGGARSASVVVADEIEPGDSDSSVIILRDPKTSTPAWLQTAINTARCRAVIVFATEASQNLSRVQNDVSIVDEFATRWHGTTPSE